MKIREPPVTWPWLAPIRPGRVHQSSQLSDFKDGSANTVMVVESNSKKIPWTAPRDLTLDEGVKVLASKDTEAFDGHRSEDFFHKQLLRTQHCDRRMERCDSPPSDRIPKWRGNS